MQIQNYIDNLLGHFASEILATVLLFIFIIIAYTVSFFVIKKQQWSFEKQRRTTVTLKNIYFLIFFVITIFVWSVELKTLILSAAAIFAAIFIVFKEVILSFVGTLISSKTFKVGDSIQYGNIKGQIIDKSFLNTTVLIFGKYQSQELVYPNMSYITSEIINLSNYGKYQSYSIFFHVTEQKNLLSQSLFAQKIANDEMAIYKDNITSYFLQKKQDDHFFQIPDPTPKITYDLSDVHKIGFSIIYISHPLDKDLLEQNIIQKYLKSLDTNLFIKEDK
jgi:hypothetical protein